MGNNLFLRDQSTSQRHRRAQFTGLNAATEKRRGDLVRSANIQATTHVASGTNEIIGSGEILLNLSFPVIFIQHPLFLYGSELGPGSELTAGNYPVLSAMVTYWDIDDPDLALYGTSLRRHFKGVQIAVTSSGPENQRLYLHWQFTGLALSNPVGGRRGVPATGETSTVIS